MSTYRSLLAFSWAMAGLAIVAAIGLIVDDRTLVGAPIWAKPLKFAVSFGVYGLTLAWMLSRHTSPSRAGRWAAHTVVAAGLIEMAIITGQTLRGRRSHFNVETPLDQALFATMGLTITVLWVATLVIAVVLFRARPGDRAATWAIRLGLLLALAGMLLGGLMLLPTPDQQAAGALRTTLGAHGVGVPDGGPAMPLTGWNTTGGDLRIPHFVGMHALQALPLFLYAVETLSTRYARLRNERIRLRLVLVAAGSLTTLLALLTWRALHGQPLPHPSEPALPALFNLAFTLAAPFWALLILAPGWRWTDRIAASPLPMVPVLAVYLALAVPVFPQLWAAVSRPDLAGFQELLRLGGGAGAIWAQVIAWDLFLGQWMYREARKLRIHPLVMGPLLALTVLLSPIGVLLFLPLRAAARRRIHRPDPTPRPHPAPVAAGQHA